MTYESFGRVGEWDGALAWGVNDHEEIDACCYTGETTYSFGGEEAEASDEKHYAHEWEGDEK